MKFRQKLLLNILLKTQRINMDQLVDDFNVSLRTIRNDLEDIQHHIEERVGGACKIEVKNKTVFVYSPTPSVYQRLLQEQDDYYLYKLSTEERLALILIELISHAEYITIDYLCTKLSVSRGTINSDILQVKKWCEKHNVRLISTKGKGLTVCESEMRRRIMLLEIIREYSACVHERENNKDPLEPYKKLFEHVNLEEIKEMIITAEEQFQFTLSDVAFEGLLIHIALAVERNIKDKVVNIDCEIEEISREKSEYQAAEYILATLQKKYNIIMPKEEIYYIALHICGKSNSGVVNTNKECIYIQLMTGHLIEKLSEIFAMDFKNDLRLYEDLYKHLARCIFRFHNNITLRNPLTESLIHEYQKIYQAVKQNSVKLEEYVKRKLPDDEIAYIVLHFAAAIERNKLESKVRTPSVIIVCSTGAGTAKLVQSRLDKYFTFHVRKVVAVHQLKKTLQEEQVDFIISTIPITEEYPHVIVSPLLKSSDISIINAMLLKFGFSINCFSEKKAVNQLAQDVQLLLQQYDGVGDEARLKQELCKLLYKTPIQAAPNLEERRLLMLSDVLKEEYISLGDECCDWIGAIRAAGNILIKNQLIEAEYVDHAIQNVKESGPYIVLTKGVAIPHASNKYGVYKTAISLVRLKKAVEFYSTENDPVKYVFMLATLDSNSHLVALSDLVSLLGDKNFFQCIDQAKDALEIINYIKEHETRV